jgi:peroxiredoxin
LREHYDQIRGLGAEVVAVGTGNRSYAAAFVDDEAIPFPVLVDDDGAAARAATLTRVNPIRLLFDPRSLGGARRAHRAGYRIGKPGARTTQLGATFVIGPADRIRYEHLDEHTADHAPMTEVLAALAP